MKATHLALFAALALTAPSQAAVLVNTFGPGDSFNGDTAWSVYDFGVGLYQAVAAPFIPGFNAVVTQIDLALSEGDPYSVFLTEDASGLPGASLADWTTPGGFVSLTPLTPLSLSSGTKYWVVVSPSPGLFGGWYWNDRDISGDYAFDPGTGFEPSNDTLPAFRVSGDAVGSSVPEPATWTAGLVGLATLVSLRRRRAA